MAGNADTIGRLIASSALLKGERELLRPRPRDANFKAEANTGPQPAPAPTANSSKALSTVLLTLLNEQLDTAARPADDGMNADGSDGAVARLSAYYNDEVLGPDGNASGSANPMPSVMASQARFDPTSAAALASLSVLAQTANMRPDAPDDPEIEADGGKAAGGFGWGYRSDDFARRRRKTLLVVGLIALIIVAVVVF